MTVSVSVGTRLDELIAAQEQRFLERQPRSRELLERAGAALGQLVGDDRPLDLRGAFPDPVHPQLPVEALGHVLAHVAAAPKICTARSATRPAISEAYSLAIEQWACCTLTSSPSSMPWAVR